MYRSIVSVDHGFEYIGLQNYFVKFDTDDQLLNAYQFQKQLSGKHRMKNLQYRYRGFSESLPKMNFTILFIILKNIFNSIEYRSMYTYTGKCVSIAKPDYEHG